MRCRFPPPPRRSRVRIRNALQKVCLAGGHLATQLNAALVAMDTSHCENFVILMANIESQTYRALYALDGFTGEVRVMGGGGGGGGSGVQ
jgi:hypothetical protein